MSAVFIAGMHRSGTSVMAATLAALGWHPGETLLDPFVEDASLVALHRRWLKAATPRGRGHRDWGMSAGGPPNPARVPGLADDAAAFATRRHEERPRWVAKDPRATWFLPEWAAAVPEARFVLVYRAPWDVVDSMVRIPNGPWAADPGEARRIWLAYNEALLRFVAVAGDRAVLVAAEAIVTRPDDVVAAVSRLTGVTVSESPQVVDRTRFVRRDLAHPIAGLFADLHPEISDLLERLDDHATVGRPVEGHQTTEAPSSTR